MGKVFGMMVLAVFLGLNSVVWGDDLVDDISGVVGIEHYDGPEAGLDMLKQNGFVVVPRFYHRIFSPYWNMDLPHYLTVDSVHRTFHVLFEDSLKQVETEIAAEVLEITRSMQKAIGKGSNEAGRLASDYFLVAECLLLAQEAPPGTRDRVAAELELIYASKGVSTSPMFGYAIDYSQFKPRGFYTNSHVLRCFFQAMSWYGNVAFRVKSEQETGAARLIAREFVRFKDVRSKWQKIDSLYSFLLAECDDLTPEEYAKAGNGPLDGLRDPKIRACDKITRRIVV